MTSFARNTGGASFVDLLKDGSKHFSGVDEAISRNIEACMKLSTIVRTSLGPNGMNKMVVNHLDKIFVTSDSSTILREMEVQHPAAKLVYLAGQMQQQEVGDHSNWVTIFAGELLHKAQQLLQMGIHQADIITGYTRASKVARESLQKLAVASVSNLRDQAEVSRALSSVIASKMHGLETIITPLVAQACVQTLPKDIKRFSVDNVRVAQVLGGALQDSSVISGFVVTRNSEGVVKLVENAKVAVFSVGIELATTETKGTVLLKNASELMNYAKTEEDAMQKMIDEIADSGVNVVVAGGPIHELALHFLERRKLMLVKVVSKFDLRRLCRFLGATALSRVGAPTKEEIGSCDRCEVREIGGTVCTVLDNAEGHSSRVATILVRTSTNNLADDVHRSIDSGVSVFKMLTKDNRLCAGAGAVEIELARAVAAVADTTLGLDQYGIRKFAESFEVVARTLAENAAQDGNEVRFACVVLCWPFTSW
jgi:T-complex protein 1 subunit theta